MPLNPYSAFWITQMRRNYFAKGRVLFLGRLWPQDLTIKNLNRVLLMQNEPPFNLNADKEYLEKKISDIDFCNFLGFESCDSLDFDNSEGATISFDLNQSSLPNQLNEKYDIIFNFGTLEHIFHLPNFFGNTFKMLKNNGIIFHSSPMNNMADHGFYQISPTLFYDYYIANQFQILDCFIVKHKKTWVGNSFNIEKYKTSDHPTDFLYGRLGSSVTDAVFIAKKIKNSSFDKIPVQLRYQKCCSGT